MKYELRQTFLFIVSTLGVALSGKTPLLVKYDKETAYDLFMSIVTSVNKPESAKNWSWVPHIEKSGHDVVLVTLMAHVYTDWIPALWRPCFEAIRRMMFLGNFRWTPGWENKRTEPDPQTECMIMEELYHHFLKEADFQTRKNHLARLQINLGVLQAEIEETAERILKGYDVLLKNVRQITQLPAQQ